MDLSGKNLVFVAGFGGIGFETCKRLMTRNLAHLIVLDVMEKPQALKTLQDLNEKTKVHYVKCNVADKESIKSALDQVMKIINYIDVLVNGAGILSDAKVEETIKVNLLGLIYTTMEAMPYLDKNQKGRGGLLVNIASVMGLEPFPPLAVYSASKFGVIGFTRSLSDPFYYNHTGVAITAICHGFTQTPMSTNPNIVTTFDFAKPLKDKYFGVEHQSAATGGQHLFEVIEKAQNGTIWLSDKGNLTLVEPKVHWTP